MKKRSKRRRTSSAIKRDLFSPKYRTRVVKSKRKYTRKDKHKDG
jgi:hypothetical protein